MKFAAFVRIRPDGPEEGVRSDDPELDDLLALARSPLPEDSGEGEWGPDEYVRIFGLTDEEAERAHERRAEEFHETPAQPRRLSIVLR